MKTSQKFCLILSLVFASSMLNAADINAGKEKSEICSGCHGVTGTSVAPMFPNLAGQKEGYIKKALKDFRAGNRKNPFMDPVAAELTDEDIDDLAAYFSKQ